MFHASIEQEAGQIRHTLLMIREHLVQQGSTRNENVISSLIQVLFDLLRHWRYLARPIQLSGKARKLTHIPSTKLAAQVRQLAIDSYRHLGLLDVARQITIVMKEVFADVPEALHCIEDDAIGIGCSVPGRGYRGFLPNAPRRKHIASICEMARASSQRACVASVRAAALPPRHEIAQIEEQERRIAQLKAKR